MFDGSVALSYSAVNFPIHVVEELNKHRIHFRSRPSSTSSLAPKPASTSSTSGKPEPVSSPSGNGYNGPFLDLSNTVGVLGGVSAASTLRFLEKLVQWSSSDGQETPPFVVCNDPVLNRELALHQSGWDCCTQSAGSIVVENLRRERVFLERAGARCIAMPCHVAHAWRDEIAEGCSVPLLDAGDCVAKELKAANLKPVEMGSNARIGILAMDALIVARLYQQKLENQGFEVLLPDKATMEHIVIPAREAFDREDMEGARNLLRISIQVLLVRAVSSIILVSDYMHGLLPADDPLLGKCVDPMDALVRATVLWATSTEEDKQ
ncbi:uncharacterized protein LOC135666384 [Musa acuminata AAA Group]|uniref:uncharacterized protein LOC103986667 n=1 Tax=Musa acuminata AAA Group TaxID=214697 RepID=UPI0031D12F78